MWHEKTEWKRIAEPQSDQYDTFFTLKCAIANGYRPLAQRSECRIFGGNTSIFENHYWRDLCPAPVDHPAIDCMERYVERWPAVYSQCRELLSAIYVSTDPAVPPGSWGSRSGPGPSGFGSVCLTLFHPLGAAEALVHEMAHHKLRALGIQVGKATKLIRNAPQHLFPSPIRYDQLRPMSAVVHAEYSYCYVLSLDLHVLKAEEREEAKLAIATRTISRYIHKLEFGFEIIRAHLDPDPEGEEFFKGFLLWLQRLTTEAREALEELCVPTKDFSHPLL